MGWQWDMKDGTHSGWMASNDEHILRDFYKYEGA